MRKVKILTVVGARPQIIKAAAISREIRSSFSDRIVEIILHTGQHYDANMSEIFFRELGIPDPDYNLNVGSGMHGEQTSLMIKGIEEVILKENPDAVILYGDTNSTLAGAIAASKLHIPVAHIEAGLRSFNKSMPEEINRIVCDHVSTWLFVPTETGLTNLISEGFPAADSLLFDDAKIKEKTDYSKNVQIYSNVQIDKTESFCSIDHPGVFHTGDVMYDNSLYFSELAESKSPVKELLREKLGWVPERYILATIHRDTNTDNYQRINSIFSALADIAEGRLNAQDGNITEKNADLTALVEVPIILPLHPRTAKMLKNSLEPELYERITRYGNGNGGGGVYLIEPASFLEMISLEKGAEMIITDSGGVQKEAFFYKKPSLILRPQTEWVEIVRCGSALLVDADYKRITDGYLLMSDKIANGSLQFPSIFGYGKAARAILEKIYITAKFVKAI